MEYPGKNRTRDQPEIFWDLQGFANCQMKLSIWYHFFLLILIHNKLSSDYRLNICFSCLFPYTDGPSFHGTSPYKMSTLGGVGNMQIFVANCIYLLTTTQEEKFEDIFLVKIANK